jgi:hypothetical protein
MGNNNGGVNSCHASANLSVVTILVDIRDSYGEAYATRLVIEVTGLSIQWEQENLVELPSQFTKCKLYAEYCFSRGYQMKAHTKGSYGKVSAYNVCSWKVFLSIWKEAFSYMKVRNPCEDSCAECFKICNSFCVLDQIHNRAGVSSSMPQTDDLAVASDSEFSASRIRDDEVMPDEIDVAGLDFPVRLCKQCTESKTSSLF